MRLFHLNSDALLPYKTRMSSYEELSNQISEILLPKPINRDPFLNSKTLNSNFK